jgi:hypothetical protein
MCTWSSGPENLFPKMIKISVNKCVMIMYENTENLEILDKEKQELIKNKL